MYHTYRSDNCVDHGQMANQQSNRIIFFVFLHTFTVYQRCFFYSMTGMSVCLSVCVRECASASECVCVCDCVYLRCLENINSKNYLHGMKCAWLTKITANQAIPFPFKTTTFALLTN